MLSIDVEKVETIRLEVAGMGLQLGACVRKGRKPRNILYLTYDIVLALSVCIPVRGSEQILPFLCNASSELHDGFSLLCSLSVYLSISIYTYCIGFTPVRVSGHDCA